MSRIQIESSPKRARILIDGDNFSHGYAIDYVALAHSGTEDGKYFFLTCGFGESGCAGLFEPIEVTSDNKNMYWHVTEPAPERWFTFTKSDYQKEIQHMIANIFLLSKRAATHIGAYGFDRDRLNAYRESEKQ